MIMVKNLVSLGELDSNSDFKVQFLLMMVIGYTNNDIVDE